MTKFSILNQLNENKFRIFNKFNWWFKKKFKNKNEVKTKKQRFDDRNFQ